MPSARGDAKPPCLLQRQTHARLARLDGQGRLALDAHAQAEDDANAGHQRRRREQTRSQRLAEGGVHHPADQTK